MFVLSHWCFGPSGNCHRTLCLTREKEHLRFDLGDFDTLSDCTTRGWNQWFLTKSWLKCLSFWRTKYFGGLLALEIHFEQDARRLNLHIGYSAATNVCELMCGVFSSSSMSITATTKSAFSMSAIYVRQAKPFLFCICTKVSFQERFQERTILKHFRISAMTPWENSQPTNPESNKSFSSLVGFCEPSTLQPIYMNLKDKWASFECVSYKTYFP